MQGMNVLCAPFLYVMPEVDAFYSFSNLLTIHAPRYAQPNLDGAHLGCNLVDEILKHEASAPESGELARTRELLFDWKVERFGAVGRFCCDAMRCGAVWCGAVLPPPRHEA